MRRRSRYVVVIKPRVVKRVVVDGMLAMDGEEGSDLESWKGNCRK